MPTYEYQCENCSEKFEKFQSITAGVYLDCPECGKPSRRLFSMGSGFISKGSSSQSVSSCESGACDFSGGGCAGGACPAFD